MTDVEEWLAALGDARKGVQRPAAEALAACSRERPEIRARLCELLGAPAFRVRWGAAYALAIAVPGSCEPVPTLLEALENRDGDLRWASANLLVRAGATPADTLDRLRVLARTGTPLARKMALYCLRDAAARDGESLAIAKAALTDGEPAVRLAALSAAAALGADDVEVARRTAELVADRDPGVARAAAATLGRLGLDTPAVRAALASAVAAPDEPLRRAATAAISRLDAAGRRPRP